MYVHGTSKRHGCRINQAVFLFFKYPTSPPCPKGAFQSLLLILCLRLDSSSNWTPTHTHTHTPTYTVHPDCSWKDAPTRYFTFLYLFLSLFSVSPPLTSAGRGSEFIAVFTALFCLLAQGQWCYSTIQ